VLFGLYIQFNELYASLAAFRVFTILYHNVSRCLDELLDDDDDPRHKVTRTLSEVAVRPSVCLSHAPSSKRCFLSAQYSILEIEATSQLVYIATRSGKNVPEVVFLLLFCCLHCCATSYGEIKVFMFKLRTKRDKAIATIKR